MRKSVLIVAVVAHGLTALSFTALGPPRTATGQTPQAEVAALLRVEWERVKDPWRRPGIEGYVYNDSTYRVGSVRLRVESLDGASRVVNERLAWVFGNIPSGSRWYFSVPLPKTGETVRVTVESFTLIAREAPRESP